jgi:hypothetical protein
MKYLRVNYSKCRIIFLDFEFYVSASSRIENGFCYNPWDKNCKLLGGSFLVANPTKDFNIHKRQVTNKIQSFWLWNHQSERDLIEKIYQLLRDTEKTVTNAHGLGISPIICGIGISSTDIPIIFNLFERYKVLSNYESFKFTNRFRIIDLSQMSIATFNNSNNFLYPKTKNNILNKYINGIKFEDGRKVWELYENKDYETIEKRTKDEIYFSHVCYEKIYEDLLKFKSLEKNYNQRKKQELKEKIEDNKTLDSDSLTLAG